MRYLVRCESAKVTHKVMLVRRQHLNGDDEIIVLLFMAFLRLSLSPEVSEQIDVCSLFCFSVVINLAHTRVMVHYCHLPCDIKGTFNCYLGARACALALQS